MCLTWRKIHVEADRRVKPREKQYWISAYKFFKAMNAEGKGNFESKDEPSSS
jgi:hypothetical protein